MKKFNSIISVLLIVGLLSGCATILGGPRTSYQVTKPTQGQPQRQVRVGYIIADAVLTGALGLIVDFATGAVYKPTPAGN